MATRDARYRVTHPDHSLQQRRLRHLRSVSARNIVAPPHPDQERRGCLLDTYFTLCTTCDQGPNSREFYRSEVIRKSLNPIWKSFELRSLQDGIDTSITSFIVQIWGGTEEKYSLLIEWKVNLGGLRYIGPRVTQDGHGQSPNTIIFGMFEGYYTAPDHNMERSQENQANASRQRALQQDLLSPRQSYNGFSLLRVHTTQRAIKQTQMAVSRIQEAIDHRMEQQRVKARLVSERETLRLRVALLHEELRKQTTSLQMEQETCKNEKRRLQQRESELEMKREGLAQAKSDLGERRKGHIEKRETLVKSKAQLAVRRRQLIAELAEIYPIAQLPNGRHTICGVWLPNAEELQGKDDNMVEAGLGYAAHLLMMIAQFLQLPLQYPIIYRGSKSKIRDPITAKLADRDREFPLYSKGKERFQFSYAVFLLNKNIAQLRYYCGLGTSDLRLTLPNLKSLLEQRLGVRFEASPPGAIPQRPLPAPPPQAVAQPAPQQNSVPVPVSNKDATDGPMSLPNATSNTNVTPKPYPVQPQVQSVLSNPGVVVNSRVNANGSFPTEKVEPIPSTHHATFPATSNGALPKEKLEQSVSEAPVVIRTQMSPQTVPQASQETLNTGRSDVTVLPQSAMQNAQVLASQLPVGTDSKKEEVGNSSPGVHRDLLNLQGRTSRKSSVGDSDGNNSHDNDSDVNQDYVEQFKRISLTEDVIDAMESQEATEENILNVDKLQTNSDNGVQPSTSKPSNLSSNPACPSEVRVTVDLKPTANAPNSDRTGLEQLGQDVELPLSIEDAIRNSQMGTLSDDITSRAAALSAQPKSFKKVSSSMAGKT
ncbi:PREDICTED: UV radiation resistance associated protein-like [Branchiostoma belcheri]|uniref:UV radiation resistance associated protein-like n=1 Tax=Branchiostoma belcheri TaxID=7741 RepID=A0A6P4ZYR6_BRABE|nr:PREDICTED: UV radiation resistance associated protein-like [Branchiostoma belcheri]